MSANGKVSIVWGDAEHVFNIAKLGQALELEDKCGAGVSEVFTRLREGRWKVNDIRETIRLGLIGAGMAPPAALTLVKRYVDECPWSENVSVATVVLMASIVGVPGDQPGKQEADRATTQESTAAMAASSDPQSTDLEPVSAGTPGKPTTQPSGNSLPA